MINFIKSRPLYTFLMFYVTEWEICIKHMEIWLSQEKKTCMIVWAARWYISLFSWNTICKVQFWILDIHFLKNEWSMPVISRKQLIVSVANNRIRFLVNFRVLETLSAARTWQPHSTYRLFWWEWLVILTNVLFFDTV